VDHRVEPPSWLPQGAAPQAADPEADEAPASDDAHALQDDSAPAEGSAEEFSIGNGHESSYTYSRDDSYNYGRDASFSGRAPFEESARPPFDELPGAAFDQTPAPPPPGEDLGGGFGSSAVTVGRSETEFGDSPADAGVPDGGFGHGEFTGSSFTGAAAAGSAGGFGTGAVDAGLPDNGPGADAPYTPYTAAFPETPTHTATVGTEPVSPPSTHWPDNSTYVYGPPTPASPPPPPPKAKQASQARRANLIVARLEPWSVMKFSFLISLVAWIVLFVAVALLYYALHSLGVFASLQKTLASVTSSQGSAGVDLSKWTSGTRVMGYTMLLGAIDVVLITALSTLGAVVYNLVTHLGGGIEITLKETE
jgi:Transmembrane domain of unknown function (DUF3566)